MSPITPKVVRCGTMFAVDMHGDGRSTHYVSNGEGWSLVEQFMAQLEPREYKIPETNLDE